MNERELLRAHGEGDHDDVRVAECRACQAASGPVQPITDTTSAERYGIAGGYAAMETAEDS